MSSIFYIDDILHDKLNIKIIKKIDQKIAKFVK